MIRSAPASLAPITAPRPTRPHPKTATVEPGSTCAGVSAAPMPVDRPLATGAPPPGVVVVPGPPPRRSRNGRLSPAASPSSRPEPRPAASPAR